MPRLKRFLSEVKAGKTPQTIWPWNEVGHTQDAKKELLKYVPFENTENVLNSVKPIALIRRMLQLATNHSDNCLVLDFFSGSASTAHAVVAMNAEDHGNRRFIAVQINEPLPTAETGIKTIFDIGAMRLRTLRAEYAEGTRNHMPDIGFRVLKIDSSNFADIHRTPDELNQKELALHTEHIKPERTPEDLLFQVLVDWGVDLALPITEEVIDGQQVFFVDGNALAACFDTGLTDELIKAIAARQPLRAVFRDESYGDDSTRINVGQLFKLLSPNTELKSL